QAGGRRGELVYLFRAVFPGPNEGYPPPSSESDVRTIRGPGERGGLMRDVLVRKDSAAGLRFVEVEDGTSVHAVDRLPPRQSQGREPSAVGAERGLFAGLFQAENFLPALRVENARRPRRLFRHAVKGRLAGAIGDDEAPPVGAESDPMHPAA